MSPHFAPGSIAFFQQDSVPSFLVDEVYLSNPIRKRKKY